MQRYFVEDKYFTDKTIVINNSDVHHIKNVMRFKIGDDLIITSYSGKSYRAVIESFGKKDIFLQIKEELQYKNNILNLCLAQALIKKDNFEMILQKTTELGIKEIYPINSDHSIIKLDDFSKKKARYEAIVKEASEQSERVLMPIINDLCSIEELPFDKFDYVLIAYARETKKELSKILKDISKDKSVLVLVGPEGGFSDKEINFLKEKGEMISLGDTILRSETAAIYITSIFRFLCEESI